MNPEFLDVEDVIEIHRALLDEHGGKDGVRDKGLLESAVMQPPAAFGGEFLHEDLFAMAAAYLFHIVKNHPFLDGNKRTGLAAALTFLDLNGYPIEIPTSALYHATMGVARGSLDKGEVADLFRSLAPVRRQER
jgi:death-on-curing protein